MPVSVKGQKELEAHIKKVKNADKFFEPDFKAVVAKSLITYKKSTKGRGKIKTGGTSNAWKVRKLGLSKYLVLNDLLTKQSIGKRYNIALLLDEGRGEIRPKKAKLLYIPLTEKGVNKSKGAKFGVDYVLSKKAKKVRGRDYLPKIEKASRNVLAKQMLKRIARA